MRQERIFADLKEIAAEQNIISPDYEADKWKTVVYEAGGVCGNMLVAPELATPKDATLELNLTGVYRIYICIPQLRSENYLYIKLSDDVCFTGVRPTKNNRPLSWGPEEFFEEIYWKTADLTGKDIVIGKPVSIVDTVTGLAWIRCVPAQAEDVETPLSNLCIQCHSDEDPLVQDSCNSEEDHLITLNRVKNTNAEFISMEFSFDMDQYIVPDGIRLSEFDQRWDRGTYKYLPRKEKIHERYVEFAHQNGLEIYAANRMEMGNFIMPYSRMGWNINFVDDNPQFHMQTRDGRSVRICSYAYPQVQDFCINAFVNMLPYGYDGITLILHRGNFVGFEEPVLQRFRELYPELDPCRLPISNPRLYGVFCEFMNQFMTKLRKAMDANSQRHIKINVITDYGLETAKYIGLDVEYWAKQGLIDSVAQCDMEVFEDLTDCMDDANPELIDMEKYKREVAKRQVLCRNFGTDVAKVCAHIPEYAALNEKYGVEVYHVLPWVHTIAPEEYAPIVEKMRTAGARKFLSWNTNHLVWDLPEWYEVSHIGNDCDRSIEQRRFHRVLVLDGYDMSQFNPNWRG